MRREPLAAAAALLAAAIALRIHGIASQPLWLDESWSRWVSGHGWRGLYDAVAAYETHPPFYYSLLKLWRGLAGSSPFALRLLSVLAGLAILPVVWICAGEVPELGKNRWTRGLATALAALSPAFVAASRQARPYALFAVGFAVALAAALRIVGDDASGAHRGWKTWFAYAVGLEATLWLHSLGAVFAASLAGMLFVALLVRAKFRELPAYVAVHLLVGLAYLPAFLLILAQHRAWTSTWLRFAWADTPSGLAEGLAMPGAGAILIFLFAAIGAAALLRSREGRPAALLLLATALVPAMVTILLSAFSSPVFLPRTLVPSELPVLLLATVGLVTLQSAPLRAAAAAASLLLMGAGSAALALRAPEEKWGQVAAFLDAHVAPGEEVWLLPNELAMPLHFASTERRPAYRIRGIPADFPAPQHRGPRYSGTLAVPGVTAADAARVVEEARRRCLKGIWLVSRFAPLFDPGGALPHALGASALRSRSLAFVPLVVDHYRLDSRASKTFNGDTGGRC